MRPLTEPKVINEFQATRNASSTIQAEFNDKVMKQGNALGVIMTMLKALIAKVDAIKDNTDMNDYYVQTQVDLHMHEITGKLIALSHAWPLQATRRGMKLTV